MPGLSGVLTIHLLPADCASLLAGSVCTGRAQNASLRVNTRKYACVLADLHPHYLGLVKSPYPRGAIWFPQPRTSSLLFFPSGTIRCSDGNSTLTTLKGNTTSFRFLTIILQLDRGGHKEGSTELPASSCWTISRSYTSDPETALQTAAPQSQDHAVSTQKTKLAIPICSLRKARIERVKQQSSKRDSKRTPPHKSANQIWG